MRDKTKKYIRDRKHLLKKNFGMTTVDYENMLSQQFSGCSICGRSVTELKRPLGIDHDHQTGTVRELLCNKCNRGLGFFNDDPELLTKATIYLTKWKKN